MFDAAVHEQAPGMSADGRARMRSAWVAIDDEAQAQAIARGLVLAGWEVGHVVHGCAAVHALARDAARLPDVLVTGLRFRDGDGDGLRLIRELGAFPDAPAVFLASRQQRAVIKAAQTLADACGLRFAGAVEQPADVAGIVAQLAGFHPVSTRVARRAEPPVLDRASVHAIIQREDVFPWMQPKVRLDTLEVVGVEALMRGFDEAGELVMPDRLIPALAAHGLLDDATLRVARQTAEFVAACLEEGMAISAAINVSMSSLARLEFCQRLAETIERVAVDPSWITIEITETDAMSDATRVIENAARIRMLGFNLAIDDFGTAYSSLTQLVRIPFSELKIERAFVTNCGRDAVKRATVSACALLGRSLGLQVVAEGVETVEDLAGVRASGCTHFQGYLVSRPIPVGHTLDWLRGLDELRAPIAP
jgi:EAL domain-containing protein (putative c-di-GMP-specific phosphodiesterase class I)